MIIVTKITMDVKFNSVLVLVLLYIITEQHGTFAFSHHSYRQQRCHDTLSRMMVKGNRNLEIQRNVNDKRQHSNQQQQKQRRRQIPYLKSSDTIDDDRSCYSECERSVMQQQQQNSREFSDKKIIVRREMFVA
jgi:hypothetical protein